MKIASPSLLRASSVALVIVAAACGDAPSDAVATASVTLEITPQLGRWRAALAIPGGEIPFELDLEAGASAESGLRASIRNGVERIEVGPLRVLEDARFELLLPPYRSRIVGAIASGGSSMHGEWQRDKGEGWVLETPFRATCDSSSRFETTDEGDPGVFEGRWRVQFSSTPEEHAVGEFRSVAGTKEGSHVEGTFLTTVGDYRYLAGTVAGGDDRTMWLSCFDGAHAFLFRAARQDDGTLRGDFWSRASWHETWTAVRDDSVELPDAFSLTRWTGAEPLGSLSFPDLDGTPRRLDDPAFGGDARLIVVFGTWCPNCADLTRLLVELRARYREAGLAILGLAFEFGDDFEARAGAVRAYVEHHGVDWPVLIAGPADKQAASAAFPLLDRVRSYPTTVFMDRRGGIEAVYTGFSGPATGPKYAQLVDSFETRIQRLLR